MKRCLDELLIDVTISTGGLLGESGDCNGDRGGCHADLDESMDSVLSFHSLNSSTEGTTPRQQQPQPQPTNVTNKNNEFISKMQELLRGSGAPTTPTTNSSSKKGKKVKGKSYFVDIQTDDVSSDNLSSIRGAEVTWTLDHDKELVSYLLAERKVRPFLLIVLRG